MPVTVAPTERVSIFLALSKYAATEPLSVITSCVSLPVTFLKVVPALSTKSVPVLFLIVLFAPSCENSKS